MKPAANRIAELRRRRGWSQARLAEMVGTSSQQISKLETGAGRLNTDWMIRIAKALECAPAELMTAEDTRGAPARPQSNLSGPVVAAAASQLYSALFAHNLRFDPQAFGTLIVDAAMKTRTLPDGTVDHADLERMIAFAISTTKAQIIK